jgi:hypothetical protein
MCRYRANHAQAMAGRLTGGFPLWATCAKAFFKRLGDWHLLARLPAPRAPESLNDPRAFIRQEQGPKRVRRIVAGSMQLMHGVHLGLVPEALLRGCSPHMGTQRKLGDFAHHWLRIIHGWAGTVAPVSTGELLVQ